MVRFDAFFEIEKAGFDKMEFFLFLKKNAIAERYQLVNIPGRYRDFVL